MKIKVPRVIYFTDYHEIPYFAENLRKILPRIKVEEVGYVVGKGYLALVYYKKDDFFRRLKNKVNKKMGEY